MNTIAPPTHFGVVDPKVATSVPGLTFLRQMLEREHPAPPFSGATRIWLLEAEEGRVVFHGEPSADFYNPMGTVHGGWTSALMDSALGCAVHSMLKPGQAYTTLEMKVNLVRTILASTGPLTCEGKIVHFGGRTATSECRVLDAKGRLMAHGTETCLIMDVARA